MKNLFLIATFLLSANAMALTEQQESYAMFCGSIEDLKELAISKGEKLTKKDIIEISKSREGVLDVLKTGKKGLQKLLDEGSRADTGPFGVIMTCGMIDQLKTEIKTEGCYDLKTNLAVKDNGGIKACSDLLKTLPH